MDKLELVRTYWGQYFKDYLSCYDEEATIDDKKIELMLLDLLNDDNIWNEIDSVVVELLIKHNVIEE